MIEVIKDNTKEKFYTLCESCLSELTYDYEDVVINDLEFNYVPDRHITCPACGKKTFAGLKQKKTTLLKEATLRRLLHYLLIAVFQHRLVNLMLLTEGQFYY